MTPSLTARLEYPRVKMTDLLELLGVAAGSAGLGAIVQAFRKPSAPDQMIKAASDAALAVFGSLEARLVKVEAQNARCEAENEHCRTENERLWARGHWLEDLLRENGINIPPGDLPGSFVVIEGAATTVFKPEDKNP